MIWGSTSQSKLDRLFRLQKRACKLILDYNVEDIFEGLNELKILTVNERIYLRKAKLMFTVANSKTPTYIDDLFKRRTANGDVPILRSYNSSSFIIPKPNREIFKQSISYSGPILWDSIPDEIKCAKTISAFHNKCIKWIKNS